MTLSVLNGTGGPEPAVELSFNGSPTYTDKRGLALYKVPDDAAPGKSLNVSLPARSDAPLSSIEILQPLSTSAPQQNPKLDRFVIVGGNRIGVLEGHNFDGSAPHDRITIDAAYEAKVLSASPVQIKILLPPNLSLGAHNIGISVDG